MLRKFLAVIVSVLTTVLITSILLNTVFAKPLEGVGFVIEDVHDGDTVYVTFAGVPEALGKHIGIRLLGIDTPELRDKDTCIKNMARVSRDLLATFLKNGKSITLSHLKRDKYFRLDGDFLVDGNSAAQHMLTAKRAQVYTGEGPKPVWKCQLDWFAPTH